MSELKLSIVCCDNSPQKFSQIVETSIDSSLIDERVLETAEQEVAANEEKGMHNASSHPEHGSVTYLQQVNEGGFSVLHGDPENLQSTFFGAGSYVAFVDEEGPGHASKVGPDGVKRTFRILRGQLEA